VGWLGIASGAFFMTCAGAAMILVPKAILEFYTNNAAVDAAGVSLLMVAAFFQLFDGVQTVTTGALRGMSNTRSSMVANFFSYWMVGLPLAWYLCFGRHLGAIGIWSGLSAALMMLAVVLLRVWQRQSRELVEQNTEPETASIPA